jgi:hypothetical protein
MVDFILSTYRQRLKRPCTSGKQLDITTDSEVSVGGLGKPKDNRCAGTLGDEWKVGNRPNYVALGWERDLPLASFGGVIHVSFLGHHCQI